MPKKDECGNSEKKFKWSLVDGNGRRKKVQLGTRRFEEDDVSNVDTLADILKNEDPESIKALNRLRRVYASI